MAKTLANYDPLVQIPSGMTPAGADFPIVESHDILVGENDKRLDAKLDDIDSAIGNVGQTPIATQLSSKVNTGDIVTSVAATGSTSNNKIPSETAVRAAIEAKTINVDSTVAQGSTNAVSGGAVHTQLATKQDVLTFDTTPTASSSNPVTSGGVKSALDTKQDTLTFDTTPTASSSNPVTSGGVKTALDGKQNTLTYETTPVVGSVNPVTSTGIRNAIDTAAAANLGAMQSQYDTFVNEAEDVLDRAASLSNGMVACDNIAAETTAGDTRILLYTGATNSTYTNGHWYYNSAASNQPPAWTDGGAVGSAPTIDNTLTTAGAAADSKSVGDAIENIVTISDTQPGSNSGNKVWIKETTDEEVQIPTYEEHISKSNKADIATNNESDNGSGTITASKAYAIGDHFYINNTNTSSENYGVSTLYKATAAIASGDAIVVGTNCEASKVADEITSLSNDLDNINESLDDVKDDLGAYVATILTPTMSTGMYYKNGQIGSAITTANDSGSSYCSIDLSAYAGKTVTVKFDNTNALSGRSTALCDSDDIIYAIYQQKDMTSSGFVFNVTNTANVLKISYSTSHVSNLQIIVKLVITRNTGEFVFVATTGNDTTGTGSETAPFATVTKALSLGYKNIGIKSGIYNETIGLVPGDVTLKAMGATGRVIFRPSDCVIATSAETVDGYTRVKSVASSSSFSSKYKWLFQDGVNDANTLIDASERLPLQRGKVYRCEDTKIIRCTSATLADALTEIETDTDYKWFYNDGTLYFSSPENITASNPLCKPVQGAFLFSNLSRATSLTCIGIEAHYCMFNVRSMTGCRIIDCIVKNTLGPGGFSYDNSTGIEFVRCEASCVHTDTAGDGFNGHGTLSGESFAHQITAVYKDCWAHDNMDDGYSDHERSETTIYGGLFEWNGKGGVTPSYGSHLTCYNAVSRHNYSGFYVVGVPDVSEGGVNTQGIFIGCIAEDNTRGSGSHFGFGCASDGNRMICVNCISNGNAYGYWNSNNTIATLMNCYGADNSTALKHANVTVKAETLVS